MNGAGTGQHLRSEAPWSSVIANLSFSPTWQLPASSSCGRGPALARRLLQSILPPSRASAGPDRGSRPGKPPRSSPALLLRGALPAETGSGVVLSTQHLYHLLNRSYIPRWTLECCSLILTFQVLVGESKKLILTLPPRRDPARAVKGASGCYTEWKPGPVTRDRRTPWQRASLPGRFVFVFCGLGWEGIVCHLLQGPNSHSLRVKNAGGACSLGPSFTGFWEHRKGAQLL